MDAKPFGRAARWAIVKSPESRTQKTAGCGHPPAMITYEILEDDEIVVIEVKAALSEEDFRKLTADVDAHLVRTGMLQGILIHAAEFPGWNSFGAMVSHFRFVRDHHRKIRKVAVSSDGRLAEIAPKLAAHFVSAELRGFGYGEKEEALAWLRAG